MIKCIVCCGILSIMMIPRFFALSLSLSFELSASTRSMVALERIDICFSMQTQFGPTVASMLHGNCTCSLSLNHAGTDRERLLCAVYVSLSALVARIESLRHRPTPPCHQHRTQAVDSFLGQPSITEEWPRKKKQKEAMIVKRVMVKKPHNDKNGHMHPLIKKW